MSEPISAGGFGGRRARSFTRIAGYTALVLFVLNSLPVFLPFPSGDSARLLDSLRELLERSTLPLVALVFLMLGFEPPALPALWECRLARLLRPLLALVTLLYLLTSLALVGLAHRVQSEGLSRFDQQLQAEQGGISALRGQIAATASSAQLRQLLEQQPVFRPVLATAESPLADPNAPIASQRARAAALLDRLEANLRRDDLIRRGDAAGNLIKQQLRLVLTALLYALYFGLGWLVWPRSLAALSERARQARAEALAEDQREAGAENEPQR